MKALRASIFLTGCLSALLLSAWAVAQPAGAQAPGAGSAAVEAAFQIILADPKVIKALEEGIGFIENLSPVEAIPDEYGAVVSNGNQLA